MFSFNGIGRKVEPGALDPTGKAGPELAPGATNGSSRRQVRVQLEVLVKPFRRGNRERTLGKVEIRARAAVRALPDELEAELRRSRRYGRSFALVRIPCAPRRDAGSNRMVELADEVGSLIRFVDRAWTDGTSVYVLLPESDRLICQGMLARIREPLANLLSEDDQAAITSAVFPDDGLTARALYRALNRASSGPAGRPDEIAPEPATSEVPVA